MSDIFQNPTSVESDLPEPYGSMMGWLSDLWEQADLMRETHQSDEFCLLACQIVQDNIAAIGSAVEAVGRKSKPLNGSK